MTASGLITALEAAFLRRIAFVRRVFSPYSSSFPIEEIEVIFEDGEKLSTIFKNLSSAALLQDARGVKPGFLYAPEREIHVYRRLLSSLNLGTAKMYGADVDPTVDRYWLFLEKVPALGLSEIGDFEIWLRVALWLSAFHASCEALVRSGMVNELVEYDADYYRIWMKRAHAAAGSLLDAIAAHHDRVIDILLQLPRTVIHGEFYPSNILVQMQATDVRVCPVDWETAAVGPGLLDVAALASGKWKKDEQMKILEAYCSALSPRLTHDDVVTAFQCCQLQIALQWLGWSKEWSPPEDHAHDWLGEALRLSTEGSLSLLFQ